MNFFLYKITNLINGKIYIGQSINPNNRWRRHKSDAKVGKNRSHLSAAIKKYGIDNFWFEIICQAKSSDNIDEAEISCIKQYNSSNKKYGYNISLGGQKRTIMSEQTKKKISEIRKGSKASEETKQRMSQSMMGKNTGDKNGMYGKRSHNSKFSLEEANSIRLEYKNGNISMAKLAIKFNVSKRTILDIIHNKKYRLEKI